MEAPISMQNRLWMWLKYAVSVFRRFSTRYFGICHFFLRYCGIGYPPMSPSIHVFLHVILLEHEQNCNIMLHRLSNTSFEPTKFQCSEHSPQVKLLQLHESFQLKSHNQTLPQRRSGSRGRVQGVRTPPPPEITCSFLIQLVFCKKKILCGLLVLK